MKKIKIIEASIFLAFCLVTYNMSFVASDTCASPESSEHGDLVVIKEVFYQDIWSEGPIEPQIGDTLNFRLTLTYYNTSGIPKCHWAYNIRVNDTLPECLDYEIGSADPNTNFIWSDDPNEYLHWSFGSQRLYDEESIVIRYNATVVGPTGPEGQKNNVTVLWDEHCTYGRDMVSEDYLILIVGQLPDLSIIKKVWNPLKHQYVDNITAYEGETLHFKLLVKNNGPDDLTDVFINDTYPDFLNPFEYSILPIHIDPINRYILWYFEVLRVGESILILFNATVEGVDFKTIGENIANVTCNEGLTDEDNVTITVEKHIIVDKKVKHPETGEWVEEIPYVKGCEPVRFRINITYFGVERMKCLLVYDQLPYDCLEYDDNLFIEIAGVEITPADENYYPDIYLHGDMFIMCGSSVEIPEGGIYFSWINQSLGPKGALENGDSVIIEFDASVVEYCGMYGDNDCECCTVTNCAEAWLWSCCEVVYHAMDCVNITCVSLPGEFNKTVSLLTPTSWGKEVYTVQGSTIKFKLELTYYGNENLTNVTFLDVLPCCLEYKDTLQSPSGTKIDVSPDKKRIWWNVTKDVGDCEKVIIIFRADVIGSSECGGCINHAYVYGYIQEFCNVYKLVVNREDHARVYAEANSPPHIPDVSGPSQGIVGVQYSFKAMLMDDDGDQISYKYDWGDGVITNWLGPVGNGEVTESHTYNTAGTYQIKVKARDEHGAESDWTKYPWSIEIKKASIDVSFEKMLYIGSVEAIVTNTGDAGLTNLNYEFNISRDSVLNFRDINVDGAGVITTLPYAASSDITSDSIGLRFGMADVKVTVTKTGVIDPTSATATAFIIGPIILVFA